MRISDFFKQHYLNKGNTTQEPRVIYKIVIVFPTLLFQAHKLSHYLLWIPNNPGQKSASTQITVQHKMFSYSQMTEQD